MEPTFVTRYFYTEPVPPGNLTCAVCGLPMADGEPLSRVIRPTFTDLDLLRAPNSEHACAACSDYMSRQELRRASWWLTATKAQAIERADLRVFLTDHLANPPGDDGYLLITATKRKHIALRASLNMAHARTRRVQFETASLTLDAALWQQLTDACAVLRRYHTWQEILSDDYQAWKLANWQTDMPEFIAARAATRPYQRSAYLDLVKFCGDKKED